MEEESNLLEAQLLQAIRESLQNHLVANSVFLAERLLAERDCEDYRNVLAECYLAEQKPYKAYEILKECRSDGNRYLFALTCFKQNKLKEAERALVHHFDGSNLRNPLLQNPPRGENVPNGAYGLYLLGQINERLQQWTAAKDIYCQALDLNPTLWIAYDRLCKLDHVQPNKVFNEAKYAKYDSSTRRHASCSFLGNLRGKLAQRALPKSTRKPGSMQEEGEAESQEHLDKTGGGIGSGGKSSRGLNTYNLKASIISSTNQSVVNSFSLNFDEGSNLSSMRASRNNQPATAVPQHAINLSPQAPPYGSVMKTSNRKTSQQGALDNRPPGSLSIYANQGQPSKASPLVNINLAPLPASITDLMTLFTRLGQAHSHMSLYMMDEAIGFFNQLPQKHLNTGWVLVNLGRCYMETTRYAEAERFFMEAIKAEPYRLEGLEYYSTCLWHLKKAAELSYVAHNALERSLYAPETWICVGNCFSLQKEHENALKFFSRAIQLNPTFSYAHCLCGHEYVYNEAWDKAKRCFEQALAYDLKNYNAWWGLGNICLKQEKFDKAVDQFTRALAINPKNPVLYTYLGMTMACKDSLMDALRNFENAEILDSNNVLNKFQKANALVRLGHYDHALKELDRLRLLMPRESPIPVLIGKIYKKLGKTDKAHYYFNLALDLENKESQKIKGLIESLHTQNEFNEDFDL